MNVNAFKPNLRKLTFLSLGIGFLALTSPLSAENSGFYGSVGFQYSNMTRAESTNGGMGAMGVGQQPNMFANQAPGTNPSLSSQGSTSAPTSPNSNAQLCVGPNCN
ncbi:hypothetical protein [Helicobacter ailurogastricus]|uniref:hypothetical protein n=1 Tax=Helicobacter ailurogastricus TaxID=1578720 RepID=UPI001F3A8BF1|nr:hypothetical protein [Helicobacter ailurogastricus]